MRNTDLGTAMADQLADWRALLDERAPDTDWLMVVEVGSTAHGTMLPGADDLDIAGIYVEPVHQVVTWRQHKGKRMIRTKPEGQRSEPGDIDAQVYSLRAWLGLAIQGNPSILQGLWCPVLGDTAHGAALRHMGPAFIGRHIIGRYRGYMASQVKRITGESGGGHGRRGSGGREELVAEHGYDTKYAMHAARLGFQCLELLDTDHLALPMINESGDWLRAVRYGNVSFDDWLTQVHVLDAKMAAALTDDRYREGPDTERIAAWCIATHTMSWGMGLSP
jgi:hypothetical protein